MTRGEANRQKCAEDNLQQQILGFLICFGQYLRALEDQYHNVPGNKLMDATFSEWGTLSDEIRMTYIKIAIFPAVVESEDILDAHIRARAIFQEFHPMAKNLPAKLPELSALCHVQWTLCNFNLIYLNCISTY